MPLNQLPTGCIGMLRDRSSSLIITDFLDRTPGGWLVPIAVLIVLSIPPLFGHEIVVILIGLTWGLGVGFGIAAAGTIIGELGTFL